MKEQFYPNWLRKERAYQEKKYFKKVVLLFSIFASLCLVNIWNTIKEIKIYELKNEETKLHMDIEEVEKDFHAVKAFNYVFENLKYLEGKVKSLNILNGSIEMKIYVDDFMEYGNIIKILEENFIIEEITPLINEDEKEYFDVRMKYYEIP